MDVREDVTTSCREEKLKVAHELKWTKVQYGNEEKGVVTQSEENTQKVSTNKELIAFFVDYII